MKYLCAFLACLAFVPTLAISASCAAPDHLTTSARSACLLDASNDSMIFGKNESERLPMASTTKIMTALVVVDHCPLDRVVTVDERACGVEGSSLYMRPGEKFTVGELLFALMLQSANDVATQLAITVAGSVDAFAELMNEKASALGLCDTHFANPHGLDDEAHYTSAHDLAVIASAYLRVPKLREICSTYRCTIGSGESTRHLVNHNRLLLMYDGTIGMKTGFTKRSGRCLVSAAERDGVTLVAVTLDDADDWNDHEAMLDYGFAHRTALELCAVGSISRELACVGGTASTVRIANREARTLVLPANHGEIGVRIYAPHFLFAPIFPGDAIGTAIFTLDGRELCRVALFAEGESAYIERKGFFRRLLDLYR